MSETDHPEPGTYDGPPISTEAPDLSAFDVHFCPPPPPRLPILLDPLQPDEGGPCLCMGLDDSIDPICQADHIRPVSEPTDDQASR